METHELVIYMDRPCIKCHELGALENGLCMSCVNKSLTKKLKSKKGGTRMSIGEPELHPMVQAGAPLEPQRPLFGEADVVINALEMELSEVKKEVDKNFLSLTRATVRKDELEERAKCLRAAIVAAKKTTDKLAAQKPE
jgi:hypothetical protein